MKRFLFLPLWLILLLILCSGVLLYFVFSQAAEQTVAAYGIYALSAYTLTVSVIYGILRLPKQLKMWRQRFSETAFGGRYLRDQVFRDRLQQQLSLGINILFAAMHMLLWIQDQSWWHVVLTAYYVVLSFLRYLTASLIRKQRIGLKREWRRARSCAWLLLTVNLTLSGAVLMMLYQGRGFVYQGYLIYAMAAFTFYTVISTTVGLIRAKKQGSPLLLADTAVSFSSALVSLLNLESAMLTEFGGKLPASDRFLMIALTGAGVSVAIVTVSVLLIVGANRYLNNNKKQGDPNGKGNV